MIGTQMFGLYKELTDDFEGTLEKLHEIGFEAAEPLVATLDQQGEIPRCIWSYELLEKGVRKLEGFGMQMPSAHVGVSVGEDRLSEKELLQHLHRIHDICGATNFVFSGMFRDARGAEMYAALLGPLASLAKADGFSVLFHNHDDEFTAVTVNGATMTALDYFYELAGEDVMMQLDAGWARIAGDETAIAEQYADRIVELHFKDFTSDGLSGKYTRETLPKEAFTAIGEGGVRTAAIVESSRRMRNFNGMYIIDQDMSAGSMLSDLQTGYCNLAQLCR